ncbi:hypothetical protein KDA_30850 [Dictyobacter alpinus]|uniref:Uncharacterized protein n=1 Tax=Dictyobacter alpinus TaxID=2014873 RepID=A0A402B8A1_9CHLR|nr:hypothetical protein [Dictyobacter alpinus]GCE27601.1 hypothetical protein KDA_30850 [Dictyobacter alpinus]
MRTQSPDTSIKAERTLIERIRQVPVSRRFRLVQSLSQRMLSGRDCEQGIQGEAIRAITIGYGQRIGQRVQDALATRPQWQEQPVDLTAALLPVMQALHEGGISSYIGGSIASSIHGMQQSASDIDLVLIQQENNFHSVGAALATLQDQYLVGPEEIAQVFHGGTSLSLIHLDTLMKIDVILPHAPDFDEAMQARVESLLIDDRYAPFPMASALEMVVWKLARCAKELARSSDGVINDAEWNDVLGVMKVQGTQLDIAQLTHWTQALNAGHLLPLALNDAGLIPEDEQSPIY